jgi:hypothetical protein
MRPTGAIFRAEDGKRLADFKRIKGEEVRAAEFDKAPKPNGSDTD